MKKLIVFGLLACLLVLAGCTNQSTTKDVTSSMVATTTRATTQTTSTTSATTKITSTTESTWIEAMIENEFIYLDSLIPHEITADFRLPASSNPEISVVFSQDGDPLLDGWIHYTPNLEGLESLLTITLTYEDVTREESRQILLVANETLYNQWLIETTLDAAKDQLDQAIPEAIKADLYLPALNIEGVSVSYDTDVSRIYNHYFIFTFPTTNTLFHLSVTIRYQGVIDILTYDIVMLSLDQLPQIPQIHIRTAYNQAVESKEDYVPARFSLTTYDLNNKATALMTEESMQIRCRGNSTFYMPKKSYRIKFDTKTSLLFDHQEDDWVLLANFADQTLLRNYLAHTFSSSLNMAFSPAAAFVDVYLNDVYLGNYLLTDQIEVTNDRVDIEEHSTDIDTGYLIELDKRMFDFPEGVEGVDWFNVYGIPYVIKSPKTDSVYYSKDQYDFIMNYIATVHVTLMNHEDYHALIDEASFIDWFIVEEVFQNVDSGYSSVFMYKDKGGLLHMGPVWDFDLSLGNPGHLEDSLRQPEGWYTPLEYKNIWYYYLMQYSGFKAHLKARWQEIFPHQIQSLVERIYPEAAAIAKSRYLNFQTWDIIGSFEDWYTAPEILERKTYEEQLAFMTDYLVLRIAWLDDAINHL